MNDQDLPPGELLARLDELTRELRRQGRAAVAAQAAAESCLERVESLTSGRGGPEPGRDPAAERWLRALLPALDALERVCRQASALRRRPEPPRRRLWPWSTEPPVAPAASELAALDEGLRVLETMLQQSLEGLGVRVERRVGVSVDPTLHRVVEVRDRAVSEQATVLEVIRPGYLLGGACIREADVAASRPRKGEKI